MKTSTTRVETFSDGVIAIIITIMILEFKLPVISKNYTNYEINQQLIALLPRFGAYIISFSMIGILWINHHHLFHLLEKTDNSLLGQNLIFLFCMSLIPFVTGIMGTNPLLAATAALYGFIMFVSTLAFAIMRSYTIKKRLVHRDDEKEFRRKIYLVSVQARTKSYAACGVYLVSVPLAFVSVYLSFICFIIPIVMFLIPGGIDEERLADKVIEKNN